MKPIFDLVDLLTRLPGIGRKSALRMAYYLLRQDAGFGEALGQKISTLRNLVRFCRICGSWTEDEVCDVCASSDRDKTCICVVEQPQDVIIIESSHEYNGAYHVLGGLISPLDGVGPGDIAIASLEDRVRKGAIRELVIATNPNVEGDTTALYIKTILEDSKVVVTRLATGIPVGGDLEYADRATLSRSFRARSQF